MKMNNQITTTTATAPTTAAATAQDFIEKVNALYAQDSKDTSAALAFRNFARSVQWLGAILVKTSPTTGAIHPDFANYLASL